jgi:hypothetical protein
VVKSVRYEVIQERLDKGGSYQLEILKLLCEIADTLLYIRNNGVKEEPVKEISDYIGEIDSKKYYEILPSPITSIKKRGRPPKRR